MKKFDFEKGFNTSENSNIVVQTYTFSHDEKQRNKEWDAKSRVQQIIEETLQNTSSSSRKELKDIFDSLGIQSAFEKIDFNASFDEVPSKLKERLRALEQLLINAKLKLTIQTENSYKFISPRDNSLEFDSSFSGIDASRIIMKNEGTFASRCDGTARITNIGNLKEDGTLFPVLKDVFAKIIEAVEVEGRDYYRQVQKKEEANANNKEQMEYGDAIKYEAENYKNDVSK